MKNVWFACQSSPQVGLGHLSRCVALAEGFKFRDIKVCFSHLSIIDERGLNLLAQSNFSASCCCDFSPDAVVVDSYELEFIRQSKAPKKSTYILLVDDTSPQIEMDLYIEASPINVWKPKNKSAYVFEFNKNPILRSAYDSVQEHEVSNTFPFEVLISLGAAQNRIEILNILIPRLRRLPEFNSKISILGFGSEDKELISLSESLDFTVLAAKTQLKDLVRDYSFVISGAGVSAWELISLGVPGFLIGVAENQTEQIKYLTDEGLRYGIMYESRIQFQNQLDGVLKNANFQNQIKISQESFRNGRDSAVSWIIENLRADLTNL
jgi:spore coat polysaccharide biosynthesis predicted glycosyltransferase SpsG